MSDYAVMPINDYVETCDTIRAKTGEISVIKSGELASKVNEVYEAGKKSEYGTFWDNFQQNGNRADYPYAFMSEGWNDTNFKPKYPLKTTNPAQMFYQCGVVDTKLECDFSICTSYTYWVFRFCKAKHIGVVDFSNSNRGDYLGGCFAFMTNCTDIDELILSEKYEFLNTFQESKKLKNVKFSGTIGQNKLNLSPCTQLTHDSLMSVINCLKDYSKDTSGTSWAVTLGTANHSKLTNAEKAIATEKGWSLV